MKSTAPNIYQQCAKRATCYRTLCIKLHDFGIDMLSFGVAVLVMCNVHVCVVKYVCLGYLYECESNLFKFRDTFQHTQQTHTHTLTSTPSTH